MLLVAYKAADVETMCVCVLVGGGGVTLGRRGGRNGRFRGQDAGFCGVQRSQKECRLLSHKCR